MAAMAHLVNVDVEDGYDDENEVKREAVVTRAESGDGEKNDEKEVKAECAGNMEVEGVEGGGEADDCAANDAEDDAVGDAVGDTVDKDRDDDRDDDKDEDDNQDSSNHSPSDSESDSETDLDFASEVAALESMSAVVEDDDDLPPSSDGSKSYLRTANEVASADPLYPLTKEGLDEVEQSKADDLTLVGTLMATMLEDRLVVVRSQGSPVNEGTVVAVRKSDVKVWKEGGGEKEGFGEVRMVGEERSN